MKLRFEGDVTELLPGILALAPELDLTVEWPAEAGDAKAVPAADRTVERQEAAGDAKAASGVASAAGGDGQEGKVGKDCKDGNGGTDCKDGETFLVLVRRSGEGLEVGWEPAARQGFIRYERKHQFFRGLGLLVQHAREGRQLARREKQRLETVGPMFDLSRNGVLTVLAFEALLRRMALMGMNTVMLYMEDTYEIEGEPYFGYMRGRYSPEELRAIDDYADRFGIEAFPSIQTLAHLEEFLKWEPVKHYKDTKGALLAGDGRTDALVRRMIEAASAPFRSRKIHIGMDEAEEVGRGQFLNRYGYRERIDIMTDHLKRVLGVTRSLGLRPMMWSDMFLKLAAGNTGTESDYYSSETTIPEAMAARIPKDVDLVYWDYVHMEAQEYESVIANHRPLGCNLVFAGAVWIFNTFGVNYGMSLNATNAALEVCKREGIGEVYATMWGDDGNEGNPFAALLGLQLYAEHAYTEGKPDWAEVASRAAFCTGVDADAFLLFKDLDEVPGSEPDNRKQSNPSKFLLYQDPLLGLFDRQVEGLPLNAHYEALERRFAAARERMAATRVGEGAEAGVRERTAATRAGEDAEAGVRERTAATRVGEGAEAGVRERTAATRVGEGAEAGVRERTAATRVGEDAEAGVREWMAVKRDGGDAELSEREGATAEITALDWMFEVPQRLCAVLKRKSELGLTLKRAYDARDMAALRGAAVSELPAIAEAVRALRLAHRAQWMRMFKPFGWEVLDIRYGGVLTRLDSAAARLLAFADGELGRIEELEQERLPFSSANRANGRGVGWSSHYYRMASPNVFYHVLNPF